MKYGMEDEQSFRRILYGSFLLYFLLAVIIGVFPLPPKKREEVTLLPPRIARLILEAPKEEPKPQEKKKVESPETKTKKEIEKNRRVAGQSGLLKLLSRDASRKDSLTEILQKGSMGDILTDVSPLAKAREAAAPQIETGALPSAGIGSVAPLVQEMGTSGEIRLADKKLATVVAPPRRAQAVQEAGKPGERGSGSIAAIVASYRGGIDFIYKKTLRENPLLKGVLTVEFTIAPSGEVTRCRVVSSTLNDPSFENLLIRRILQWKFPPLPGGENTTVTYPLEFSPV
jgi:TonB family protein